MTSYKFSSEFIQKLTDDIKKNDRFCFKEQVWLKWGDNGFSDTLLDELRSKLPPKWLMTELDVNDFDTFDDILKGMVEETERVLKDSGEIVNFSAESILKFHDPKDVRDKYKSAVADIVEEGKRLIFAFKHYEGATNRWLGGFGWMRSFLTSRPLKLSALVFTAKPMDEVSDEPEGSSPFWNIFNSPVTIRDEI